MVSFLKQWHYSPNKDTNFDLNGHFTGQGASEKFISKVNSTPQQNLPVTTTSVTKLF